MIPRRPIRIVLMLSAILLSACVAPAEPALPWPIDPDAVTDPARMVVTPMVAAPGQLVELTFPGGHDRGVLFAIDETVADGWERRAMLVSDANGGSPQWSAADGEGMVVEMVGIGGVGPDRVPIPDGLSAGAYRVCTANAVENLCVPIEVVAP